MPRALRLSVGLAACLAPLVVVGLSPLRADAALVYIGLLPTLVSLTCGARVAFATAGSTGLVVLLGLLLSGSPLLAAGFMVLLGVGVVWSYRRGWQAPATYVATQGALAVAVAPTSRLGSEHPDSVATAVITGLLVLLAGLWVALVGALLLRDLEQPATERPTDAELRLFAVTLGVALGVGTYLVMTLAPRGNAWWILLTILVVIQPGHRQTATRAAQRAGGTVLGGVVAASAVVLVDSRSLLALIALAAAVASVVAQFRAPYWIFSASLTVALVLLTQPAGRVLRGDLERVAYTMLAAVLVVGLSLAVRAASGAVAARGRASPRPPRPGRDPGTTATPEP